jgi:hypothetical protein
MRLMLSVRGMGVAESVKTSTRFFNCLRRSLWATPNLCSSSTTTRPRSRKAMSFESRRCVPMMTSISPDSTSLTISFCSLSERKREMSSTFTGKAAKRERKVS